MEALSDTSKITATSQGHWHLARLISGGGAMLYLAKKLASASFSSSERLLHSKCQRYM